jgi:hypothetical protein
MTRQFITILLALFTLTTTAQNKMRPLDQLINTADPGWPLVQGWIKSAKNKVEILPVDTAKAKDALYKTQVTTRSPMGAIVYETGGILIDDGWIRILGSGNEKLNRTLPDWNKGKSFKEFGDSAPFYLIADDAIGGFYMLNGGGLGKDLGKVYYISPDNLEYEPLDITYSDFLDFCFNTDLNDFYRNLRWMNWRDEVSKLDGNKVFNFFPPLFTKEGKDFTKNHKSIVPVGEQYSLMMSFRKQLGIDK